jgi:hypothetical protein
MWTAESATGPFSTLWAGSSGDFQRGLCWKNDQSGHTAGVLAGSWQDLAIGAGEAIRVAMRFAALTTSPPSVEDASAGTEPSGGARTRGGRLSGGAIAGIVAAVAVVVIAVAIVEGGSDMAGAKLCA